VAVEFRPGIAADVKALVLARVAVAVRERTGIRMTVEEAAAPLPKGIDDRRKARRWTDLKARTL
jgi:hypothetical protein